jgi:RHS repeat-associated protein
LYRRVQAASCFSFRPVFRAHSSGRRPQGRRSDALPTWDGDGRRVEKSSGTLYWYDDKGNVIEETDLSGNLVNDYFYAAGMRVWREDSSGGVYTYLSDPLGSVRYVAGPAGTESESDWYPFGGERVISDTLTSSNHYKFTGMERDTETGLDHTLYRQFSFAWGRWYSPDSKVGNVLNPQTWNRYAYVTNNPATFTDPLVLSNGNPYSPSAPPCGGTGQISCQQYFQVTGPAPASDCGAEYSQCYATVGGAVIGINGLNATAFIPAHQVTANGNACTAGEIEDNECDGGLSGQTVVATGTAISTPGGSAAFIPSNASAGGGGSSSQSATIGPQDPPAPPPTEGFWPCVSGELVENFLGGERGPVTVTLHIAAILVGQGSGSLIPGPGWLYMGTAAAWDVAMAAKAYATCK